MRVEPPRVVIPCPLLESAITLTAVHPSPRATPRPVQLRAVKSKTRTLSPLRADNPSPPNERTDPLRMVRLVSVPLTRMPLSDPSDPSTRNPMRSSVTLLALISIPLKPDVAEMLPVR